MTNNIAIIASLLHHIRHRHLIEWYEDISKRNLNTQLFLGSKNKKIPFAKNFKINSKIEYFKYKFKPIGFQNSDAKLQRLKPLALYKPKIIHLLTSNTFEVIAPILEVNDTKLIVSFRGYDINVFPFESDENRVLTKRIFDKADVLHFISEGLLNTALELGADKNKCVIIRRSIRTENIPPLKTSETINKKPIILSVGRLVWEKGYLYALEAIAILKAKGYEFEYQIAGKGIDYQALVYHVNRLNIEDCVVFLGELSREKVKQKLALADIYFQPSLTEALSLAIIEASYYGLPIVSSDIGGVPEVVEHATTGFLSEICNPTNYANNLEKLLKSSELRLKMGEAAQNHILQNFSRKEEIKKWETIYKQLEQQN